MALAFRVAIARAVDRFAEDPLVAFRLHSVGADAARFYNWAM